MSDSGFPQFPPFLPPLQTTLLTAKAEAKAKVIAAEAALARLEKPVTVRGEVIRVHRDGSVQVKTDQGSLTLKFPDRALPAEGQTIDIELSAGAPPRQAVVRPAPSPSAPTAPLPTPRPDTPAARPALDQTTQIRLSQQQSQRNDMTLPDVAVPQILPEGAIVRLTPLPAPQAQMLIDQILEMIQTRITTGAFSSLPPSTRQESVSLHAPLRGIPAQPLPSINLMTHIPSRDLNPVEIFMRQILAGSPFAPPAADSPPFAAALRPSDSSAMTDRTLVPSLQLSLKAITLPRHDSFTVAAPVTFTPLVKPAAFMDVRVHHIIPSGTMLHPVSSISSVKAPVAPVLLHSSATTMPAQVVALSSRNFPVLSLMIPGGEDPQFFTMNFPASHLVPGSILAVRPQPGTAASIPATPPTVFELMSGFRWPLFEELIEQQGLLLQSVQKHAFENILPNPAQPSKLPAAALLFIAAVRAGDLSAWMGERNIDSLRRSGRAEFISRMMREFSSLNKLASEPVTPEWRGMSIPLYHQGQVDKIHLYYRYTDHDQNHDREQAEKGKGTRFIFDMHLSIIGDVQLDGYARGRLLDLAVRTHQPFSAAMRHEMTRRYIHTLEVAGFEGSLIFQSQPDKWVKITPRQDLLSASV